MKLHLTMINWHNCHSSFLGRAWRTRARSHLILLAASSYFGAGKAIALYLDADTSSVLGTLGNPKCFLLFSGPVSDSHS